MSLTDEETDRLGDVVELQPTKNKELQNRWGLDSGSEVHRYLENHLKDYYFRDDNSLIRTTAEAVELTGVEPGVEPPTEGQGSDAPPSEIRVSTLESQVFSVVAGPDERSESVVSVLTKLREQYDVDPDAGDVRRALQSLKRKNVVEVIYRTVPTFRLSVERDAIDVSTTDE